MGVRARLSKMFGPPAPADMQAAAQAAGMSPTRAFAPGEPIGPYDGYSRTPRSHDYQTGYNIAARPRRNERVSFETLRSLVDAYDVAQMCIWHRIDSLRALKWSLVPKDGIEGDVTAAIKLGTAALKRPDRRLLFKSWLAKWVYDILAYDAGTLYRQRNRAGRAIGLKVVDGTTIAPLLDYWGDTPEAPAEAYVQYAQGIPWNWLTTDDLIYEPFRPRSNTPYGNAPLETILLNANTDLRFQAYFLQRFTQGNIPEAFASAPETWTPNQIEEFQQQWDALMLGDQAAQSQIRWIPGGGKIEWSNEKDFTDEFSLFLMRKTCGAYHVVPSDLGFTESVNRSSGETQADVADKVGERPLAEHCQDILSAFLQDDLGLPLDFKFDIGDEEEDRLQTAQADGHYIDRGVVSSSEIRQMRYGLPEPDGIPVPRYIYSARAGAVPLSALYAVAGPTDPESAAPEPGSELPHKPFALIEGVAPQEPPKAPPLAVVRYPEDNQSSVQAAIAAADAPVTKEQTAGITADTGATSYDLIGDDEDEDEIAKAAELAAFRRFGKARRRDGRWRDFEFTAIDDTTGHRLNDRARAQIRKAAGQLVAAGLAVRAADTGRVLMLQRALDPTDPAGGKWEFPGGHIEDGETPLTAACREWQEEVGCLLPVDVLANVAFATSGACSWLSPNGIYGGFIATVASESLIDIGAREQVTNPDDPDGDIVEAVAWWDPADMPGSGLIRAELAADLELVLAALGGRTPAGAESTCPCGTPVVFDEIDGWQHADGSISHDGEFADQSVSDLMRTVAKAASGSGPKALAGATGPSSSRSTATTSR
jgi:8-oxo-dGTP pyrophosphatase MutT (NUDIX family)